MKISILLPYKENFSPSYPGAVSLFVKDTAALSKYKKDIVVYGAGDKAISIGEKSKISIEDISVFDSNIGLASKDNSNVNANKVKISNTRYGVVSYMKKNEYGPSKIIISDILISNSEQKYLVEKGSSIKVDNRDIPAVDFDFKNFM
mgnify:CR=1 FL=1